ncbi:hypothetical protein KAU11_09240 [Candidatus Babeliales bacterium]|nr:hypothetical protein [Candidatus Babeliales bacterium]
MKFKNVLILFGLLLFVGNSFANDVDVSDQQMEVVTIDQDFVFVSFDLNINDFTIVSMSDSKFIPNTKFIVIITGESGHATPKGKTEHVKQTVRISTSGGLPYKHT